MKTSDMMYQPVERIAQQLSDLSVLADHYGHERFGEVRTALFEARNILLPLIGIKPL